MTSPRKRGEDEIRPSHLFCESINTKTGQHWHKKRNTIDQFLNIQNIEILSKLKKTSLEMH